MRRSCRTQSSAAATATTSSAIVSGEVGPSDTTSVSPLSNAIVDEPSRTAPETSKPPVARSEVSDTARHTNHVASSTSTAPTAKIVRHDTYRASAPPPANPRAVPSPKAPASNEIVLVARSLFCRASASASG